jgi:hypothetical protein
LSSWQQQRPAGTHSPTHPLATAVTGVEEMFSLGERLRDRFPQISQQRYYPKRFPLVSTQVGGATSRQRSGLAGGLGLWFSCSSVLACCTVYISQHTTEQCANSQQPIDVLLVVGGPSSAECQCICTGLLQPVTVKHSPHGQRRYSPRTS